MSQTETADNALPVPVTSSAEEAAASAAVRTQPADADIATKQHAALGNPMAAKALADKQSAAADTLQPTDWKLTE